MAKKTKQKKAWKLEVDEINRQLKEISEKRKEFLNRKRELIEQNTKHRTPKWDDYSPLKTLVYPYAYDTTYKEMIKAWQKYSVKEILPLHSYRFEFDILHQEDVIRALDTALSSIAPTFKVRKCSLFRYLSTHSNLGSYEAIRKMLYRASKKKVGTEKNGDS